MGTREKLTRGKGPTAGFGLIAEGRSRLPVKTPLLKSGWFSGFQIWRKISTIRYVPRCCGPSRRPIGLTGRVSRRRGKLVDLEGRIVESIMLFLKEEASPSEIVCRSLELGF
jgi:hypothetical protein